jgi:acetyl-CoA carboxylase biotin carboxyl carrier protein
VSISSRDLDEIMRLFDQSGFGEMKLEAGDFKLHLRKAGVEPGTAVAAPMHTSPGPQAAVPALPSAPAVGTTIPPLGPGEIDVPSPLLGIFYRTPKPSEPPFVEIGQDVDEDTVVGIIEVMKLMNSVRAGVRGKIVAIHAPNAEMVEFDQPLMRIEAAA